MKEGAKYELYVPAELAYGAEGNQNIEPNSTLIFTVELLTPEQIKAEEEKIKAEMEKQAKAMEAAQAAQAAQTAEQPKTEEKK